MRSRLAAVSLLLLPAAVLGASVAVVPADRNFGLTVLDMRGGGDGAAVLYYTHPAAGQAHISEPCALSYYVLELEPGLPGAAPEPFAPDHCSRSGAVGKLLDGGEILLIVEDRVEVRRRGSGAVQQWTLAGHPSIRDLSVAARDVARDGGIVVALAGRAQQGRDAPPPAASVVRLAADGTLQWRAELSEAGVQWLIHDVWAGADGGALLHTTAYPAGAAKLPGTEAPPGVTVSSEGRLYFIDAAGRLHPPMALTRDHLPDFESLARTDDPGALAAAFENLLEINRIEGVTRLAVHARDGGYDVLVRRNSSADSRDGDFYYRLAQDGFVAAEIALTASINGHGIAAWADFFAGDGELALLVWMAVTDHAPPPARRTMVPRAVSRIDLRSGGVASEHVPIDEQHVNAYLRVRDEEIQTLRNLPDGEPERVVPLGDGTLAVSIGRLDGRAALRLDELR